MKDKRLVIGLVGTVYFYIDMMVGYAYWLTIHKINQLIGVYTYHYSAPAPFVNILIYRGQINLFEKIPEFSMILFRQALQESVISFLFTITAVLAMFGVQIWRESR